MGQFIDCDNIDTLASEEEILNALYVRDNAGNVGLRAMFKTAAAANITPMIECGAAPESKLNIFRGIIGLTPDNKPAIVFISEA